MFDAPEHVRWASIPLSALDQPSHRALALQVARESMVLLKNTNATLPLRKTLGTIAVIGPNADQARMLLGNYNGEPSDLVTPLRGIRSAVSKSTRVLYARGSDLADDFPVLDLAGPRVLTTLEGLRLVPQYDAAVALASLPEQIRGYGHVRARSVEQVQASEKGLLDTLKRRVIPLAKAA